MENLFEIAIALLILLFGGLGSLFNKKEQDEDVDTDMDIPPEQQQRNPWQVGEQTPPVAPIPPRETPQQQRQPVWGQQIQEKVETYTKPETRDERWRHMQQTVRDQAQQWQQKQERSPIPIPIPTRGSQIGDMFRDLFQLEERFERDVPPPPVKPVTRPQTATPMVQKSAIAPSPDQGHRLTRRKSQFSPVLLRAAQLAQRNPLMGGVIYAEILKRPAPIRPFPKTGGDIVS